MIWQVPLTGDSLRVVGWCDNGLKLQLEMRAFASQWREAPRAPDPLPGMRPDNPNRFVGVDAHGTADNDANRSAGFNGHDTATAATNLGHTAAPIKNVI